MTILFVMDSYGLLNNGTSSTAQRFANELRKRGNIVRILGVESPETSNDPYYYGLKKFYFPIFQPLIDKQGFAFAKCDDVKKIVEAIKGCDIVHLFLPFPLENRARIIAQSLKVPVTTAFHLQCEDITYSANLGHVKFINRALYRFFYLYFYQYIRHVHCPSLMMAKTLKKYGYKNNVCHVISNGVSDFFKPIKADKPVEFKDKFVILMIGRLSKEKRQDVLIKAIKYSKYNDKIQLILCGQGPTLNKLQHLSTKCLKNPLLVRFVKQEELRNIINYSDLYVHASDIESEAIACIEAFTCGLVPVISNNPNSATNQFALDKVCLFKHGNYKDLAKHIDYFIEHPEIKEELSKKYLDYSKKFRLEAQVKALENVFKLAINEHKEGKDLIVVKPSKFNEFKMKKIKKIIAKEFNFNIDDFAKIEK